MKDNVQGGLRQGVERARRAESERDRQIRKWRGLLRRLNHLKKLAGGDFRFF